MTGHGIDMASKGYTDARPLPARGVGVLLLVGLVVVQIAPMTSPFVLALSALAVVGFARANGTPLSAFLRPAPVTVSLLGLAALALLSSLWSLEPARGAPLALSFALSAVLAGAAVRAVGCFSEPALHRLGQGVVIALAIGAVMLAIEVGLAQPLKRALYNAIPLTRPESLKGLVVDAGRVTDAGLPMLNRSVAALMLLLFPALLVVRSLLSGTARRIAEMALLVLATLAIAQSAHESSKLALAAAIGGYGLCRLLPRASWYALGVGYLAVMIAVVPLALAAYRGKLHERASIQDSGRARLILWGHTAELTLRRPMLGHGIETARVLDERTGATAPKLDGQPFAVRTGRHAHNIYLQAWFEMGLAGALAMLLAGLLIIRAGARSPPAAAAYVYATLAAGFVIAGLAWGLWQPWLAALYGLTTVALLVGVALARGRGSSRPEPMS